MPLEPKSKQRGASFSAGESLSQISNEQLLELAGIGQALDQTKGLRPLIKSSLEFWCTHVLAMRGLKPAAHHLMLIDFLQRMVDGEFDRGIVSMPPGYAKTEYVSVLFPPWFLARFPDESVIAASNTADLAVRNGRKVRNLIQEYHDDLGYGLSQDQMAAGQWGTDKGGEFFAAGVGGTIIGRRAALAVVDDPIRSRAEVEIKTNRDNLHSWYKSSLLGRMKPFGKIILMHTRWHKDDLAGRVIEDAKEGGDEWKVLSLPAIALENDPMGREPGEPLWPAWENKAKLARKKIEVGSREWSSQYQQNPVADEGNLFVVDRILKVPTIPGRLTWVCRAWDLASTEETGGRDPDYTVGVKFGILSDNRFIILNVVRARGTPGDVTALIVATAKEDGPDVPIELPQDPGQAGKSQISYLTRELMGHIVKSSTESGSKYTRAMPFASQIEAHNVLMLEATWNDGYIEELRAFPSGSKDDQVDASSRAFNAAVGAEGGAAIIEFYKQRATELLDTSRRGPGQRPSTPAGTGGPTEWADIYNAAYAEVTGSQSERCHACNKPLGRDRMMDGVNQWHVECFR